MNKITYILFVSAIILMGCAKPYNPPEISTNTNILVVEGLINTGADSTIIRLSRTVLIANKTTSAPETKATVTVENAQGTSYALPESSVKGVYAAPALNLDNTKKYRVRIKTINGRTYVSDLVDPKIAPPIDSIGFTIKERALQIYVNAHDATNNTRYYKYDYSETWQFNARYPSNYISNGFSIVARTPAQQIFYCYGRDTSANTVITSTASLSSDVVYQLPVVDIDTASEKIGTKYSILVSQVALSKEAYSFWENLRKNTEQLGSIFDAQPSQLTGNVHNLADPAEPVIGYISAGTVRKKRIFITKAQLPQSWLPVYPYSCNIDTANYDQVNGAKYGYAYAPATLITLPVHGLVISHSIQTQAGIGEAYTSAECADCTVRGKTQQPAFWK